MNIIVLLGPTASGKTRLAAHIADMLHTGVISADSRQVFRGMDIGTGKDYNDYIVDGRKVPYYLIDIEDAGNEYHIQRYMDDFYEISGSLQARGETPVLCGGSGLYLDAVLRGFRFTSVPVNETLSAMLEMKSKEELVDHFKAMPPTEFTLLADLSSKKRLVRAIVITEYLLNNTPAEKSYPAVKPLILGLDPGREQRRMNIEKRLEQRLNEGLVEEVKQLMKIVPAEKLIRYGLEYKFVVMHLQGALSYHEMKEKLTVAIQQFAKRQMTYFRKMEKDGAKIHWLDTSLSLPAQLAHISGLIKQAE